MQKMGVDAKDKLSRKASLLVTPDVTESNAEVVRVDVDTVVASIGADGEVMVHFGRAGVSTCATANS